MLMIALTNFISKEPPPLPPLDPKRASLVLTKVDEILRWENKTQQVRHTHFVEQGVYLWEMRAGQYWRLEKLNSFDHFLETRFPDSRRKAYYLMSIHDHLPKHLRSQLKQLGWSKHAELLKVARSDGRDFECAAWLHKARSLPKEEFRREVEKHLTGKDTEPYELMYFKIYRSQLAIVEEALETAALMLGSDKSRGYCLE